MCFRSACNKASMDTITELQDDAKVWKESAKYWESVFKYNQAEFYQATADFKKLKLKVDKLKDEYDEVVSLFLSLTHSLSQSLNLSLSLFRSLSRFLPLLSQILRCFHWMLNFHCALLILSSTLSASKRQFNTPFHSIPGEGRAFGPREAAGEADA